jgi:hypothetical protein
VTLVRVAAIVAVAAVGCSTPVGGQPDALPITTVGTDAPTSPSGAPEPTPLTSALEDPVSLELPTRLSWSGASVTSSHADADGSVYSTGTFYGTLSVSGWRVVSKGSQDVFVAKFANDGSLVWLIGAGSPEKESEPQITGVDPGRVHVVGITQGRMDCGGGPLPVWSTETFFVCTFNTDDGHWLGAGTFPTGSP